MVGGHANTTTSTNGRTIKLLEILNVRVVGNGDRFLILSHGFGTDQSAWQRILPFLTRDYKVILYDLVCAGSVNPDHFHFDRYTTLDAFVDDLLAILDALRIHRCAFIGHSFSAMIGILAAIRRPELFSKLILVGASPRFLLACFLSRKKLVIFIQAISQTPCVRLQVPQRRGLSRGIQ